MKKLFTFIFTCLISFMGFAQETVTGETASEVTGMAKLLDNLSFVGSFGSPSLDLNPSEFNLNNASGSVNLGQLGVAYKVNGRITIGLSAMGALGNCNSGYLDQEGNLISFYGEDDEDGDEDGEMDDDEDECNDDLVDNIAGTVTVQFSEALPLFLQATGGYSIGAGAPAISAMIGYHQDIFAEMGIYIGIRYSDVFHKIPSGVVDVTSSSGLKAELGFTWNF